MKLHLLSDLHTEMAPFSLPETEADAVVLAGDIGVGVNAVEGAIAASRRLGKPIVYVPGNHEFYRQADTSGMHGLVREMKRISRGTNVHVLDDDEVVLGDVRFLGCTLWTDFDLFGEGMRDVVMMAAGSVIKDFKHIFDHGNKVTPSFLRERHWKSRKWLERRLDEGAGKKTIIITHHGPHPRSCPGHFRHDPVSAGFFSDLQSLILGHGIDLWAHGHVHAGADYRIGETRIVCNPRGYPGESVPGFRPDMIVTV